MTEFVEKPAPDQIDTNNISAGVYVLERSVLDLLEPGQPASIERDVFPRLVGDGLYGHVAHGYWMDIGTPERYLQATFDILEGTVATEVVRRAWATRTCASRTASRTRGRIDPAGARRERLPDRRGRADRRPRRCSSTASPSARARRSRLGRDARRRDRRATARCAAASSPPACGSATTAWSTA